MLTPRASKEYKAITLIVDPRTVTTLASILEEKLSNVAMNSIITIYRNMIKNKDLSLADDITAIEVIAKVDNKPIAALDYFMEKSINIGPLRHLHKVIVNSKKSFTEMFHEKKEKKIIEKHLESDEIIYWITVLSLIHTMYNTMTNYVNDALVYVGLSSVRATYSRVFTILRNKMKEAKPEGKTKAPKKDYYKSFFNYLGSLDNIDKAVILSYLIMFNRLSLICIYDPILAKLSDKALIKANIFYLKNTNQHINAIRSVYRLHRHTCSLISHMKKTYEDVGNLIWYLYRTGMPTFISAYKEGLIPQTNLEDLTIFLLEFAEVFLRILHLLNPSDLNYFVTPARILKVLLKKYDMTLRDLGEEVIKEVINDDQEIGLSKELKVDENTVNSVVRGYSMYISLGILKKVLGKHLQGYKYPGITIAPPGFPDIIGALYLSK